MSDQDLAPLPEAVARLLDTERPLPPAPAELVEQVWTSVSHTVALPPVPAATPNPAGAASSKLAAVLGSKAVIAGLAFVLGGASVAVLDRLPAAQAPLPPSTVVLAWPAPVPPPEPGPGDFPAPEVVSPPPRQRAPERKARPDATLAEERAMLEVARTALGRGRTADALEAVTAHARRFPRGQLAEERESVWILALQAAGRTDEAKARARTFARTYPDSILRRGLRELLEDSP